MSIFYVYTGEMREKLMNCEQHHENPDRFLEDEEVRFWWTAGIGCVIATGVIAWLIVSLPVELPSVVEQGSLDTVTISLNVEKTFKLAFESSSEMQAATLFLKLPAGVEVPGFEGLDTVAWTTAIEKGSNILELPIIVRSGDGGTILARLEHEGKQKTFLFAVTVI
jgi:hypothetical protein